MGAAERFPDAIEVHAGPGEAWVKIPRSALDTAYLRRVRGRWNGVLVAVGRVVAGGPNRGRVGISYAGADPAEAIAAGLMGDQYNGWSAEVDADEIEIVSDEMVPRPIVKRSSMDSDVTPPGIADESIVPLVQSLELKEMDAALLVVDIRSRAVWAGFDLAGLDEAIALAAFAHRAQRRRGRADLPSTAYIEHPLRNAARVLRWGVTAESIVIAALLHDTVEDHAGELAAAFGDPRPGQDAAARAVVLAHYARRFGERTAALVEAMSNPLETDGTDGTDERTKHERYRTHVVAAIADPEVAVCKLADLVDNALSLHHTRESTDDPSTRRLARKYSPLLPLLRERIAQPDVRALLSVDGWRTADDALRAGIDRMSELRGDDVS